ncbi:MAG: hypothetical protein KAR45_10970 [Desulfobacteraceae bacterium]|nr:hypothetical protein [Desulfobacteraceae bacterium]
MELKKIFIPSVGVDLVFNLNSLTPYAKSSIIYDINHDNQTVIIAQPLNPVTKNAIYDEMHLTAVTRGDKGKIRVGIKCEPIKIIKDYKLAGNTKVDVIQLKIFPPLTETANIRSAYRLPLSSHFSINGKIIYLDKEYITKKDFIFRDVSFAGSGIICPKKVNLKTNPLTKIEVHDTIKLGMILLKEAKDNTSKMEPVAIVPATAEISRLNINFSETHVFIGLKFINISSEKENALNAFIHEAQVDELQRLSRM